MRVPETQLFVAGEAICDGIISARNCSAPTPWNWDCDWVFEGWSIAKGFISEFSREEVSWTVEVADAAGWILDVVFTAVSATSRVFDVFEVTSSIARAIFKARVWWERVRNEEWVKRKENLLLWRGRESCLLYVCSRRPGLVYVLVLLIWGSVSVGVPAATWGVSCSGGSLASIQVIKCEGPDDWYWVVWSLWICAENEIFTGPAYGLYPM